MENEFEKIHQHLIKVFTLYGEDFPLTSIEENPVQTFKQQDFMILVRFVGSWMRHKAVENRHLLFLEEQDGRVLMAGNTEVYTNDQGKIFVSSKESAELISSMQSIRFKNFAKTVYCNISNILFSHYLNVFLESFHQKVTTTEIPDTFINKVIKYSVQWLNYEQHFLRKGVRWWSVKTHQEAILFINRKLWDNKIFRKDIFSLAVRIHGMNFKLQHYNDIAENFNELKKCVDENPKFAPWHHRFTIDYREGYETSPNRLKDLKHLFLTKGGTEQGWKWLNKQGWKWIKYIHPSMFHRYAKAINILASLQIGRIPFHQLFILHFSVKHDEETIKNMAYAIKALIIANRKRQVKIKEVSEILPNVIDYVQLGLDKPLHKKISWKTLWDRQRIWHEQRAWINLEQLKKENKSWIPLLTAPLVDKDLMIIELNQSIELIEEGEALHHCVGTYVDKCLQGDSRIFSIRRGDQRIGTVELTWQPEKGWCLSQCRGMYNKTIKNTRILQLVNKLVQTCAKEPNFIKFVSNDLADCV